MQNSVNIMLDLETLDTAPSAIILSIGAVRFDLDNCYERIYLVSASQEHIVQQRLNERTSSTSTELWWDKQSEEARALFKDEGSMPLNEALDKFATFCDEDAKVWGNGSDFDNVLLVNAYHMYGKRMPWKYYNSRCFRTLKNLVPESLKPVRAGVHHNALDDAIYQALWAQAALKYLGVAL